MYASISRGDRMGGLLAYLQGPGKANEHTRPHLVAGDPLLMSWHTNDELTRGEALAIARHLNRPWQAYDTEVTVPVYEQVATGARTPVKAGRQRVKDRVKVGERPAHVWHCSLSLRAEEGELGDAKWQEIAHAFVDRMGFGEQGDPLIEQGDGEGGGSAEDGAAGGAVRNPDYVAGCRWVAVHHGVSEKGNDHIHIAVNLVREDGTKADTFHDYRRARDLCRELEREFDLMPLNPNEYELARSHARAAWETSRRAEVGAGDADARVPWAELDDAAQEQQVGLQFPTPAAYAAAKERSEDRSHEDTVEERYEPAEQAAAARRTARGRFEQARRDALRDRANGADGVADADVREWSALSVGERQQLIDQASQDLAGSGQPRFELARTVRACATASESEDEFVRRVRQHGVLIRPRFAEGFRHGAEGTSSAGAADAGGPAVVGYSVAAKPVPGERPVWYGGGSLGKDLTLPRLRAEWSPVDDGPAAGDGTDDAAGAANEAALREWTAASRGRRPAAPGREVTAPGPELWQRAESELAQLREQLRAVPIEDRQTWAQVARQTSGAFAAWSLRVESTPGPLAATADALARSSTIVEPRRAPRPKMPSAAGTAYLLLAASRPGPTAYAAVLKQLANLAKAIHDMHRAEAAARRARTIQLVVRRDLDTVSRRLQAAGVGSSTSAETTSPPSTKSTRSPAAGRPRTGPRQAPGAPGRPDRGIGK
ncbi:relaxase/mobilization nuclease-like protein [Nocardioides sp. J9]|uniref:relaxase/mobilization nuclease domain-containing protein n=1 Tax=Nocardioides sp. J9 TaxID=935844 RepID=UPI0011A05428|nr:relaxase/mobilization nuclease domain-containing protein [Nocardioides sp. J9]TWH03866.1 relaxase/mobilization nuclease-like protein [Nocardioides sp. J9]